MKERFSHFPPLPEPWPKVTDFVPGAITPPRTETTPATGMVAADRLDTRTGRTVGPVDAREKQPRITLAGRLGSPVTYGQTPKGQPKAHFMLGVHTPTETGIKTDWKTVRTFGERVAQLRALGLAKGEAARVIGYVHPHEETKNGKTKVVEEIYATVIQRL